MDLITFAGILCFLATVVYYIYIRGKQKEGFPPGPWRLPYIGNGHQIGMDPFRPLSKWAKEYGPIFHAQMGTMDLIVLSDPKLGKEAFANPNFSGKPDEELFMIFSGGGKYGIIASEGETWQEQRRFTMRHLRDFGLGKKMEPLIMEEVNEFIQWLKKEEGSPVALNKEFNLPVLNSLWMIMHGQRFKHDDPRLHAIFKNHHDVTVTVTNSGMLFLITWLAKLFPNASGWNQLWGLVHTFQGFFRESVEEHQATLGDDPRDFVDAYLNEMKAQAKTSSSFNEINGMKNFLAVLGDLFLAGYETTSITLTWLFLYLATSPSVLKKFQNEIDTVVGKSRQPNLGDRPKMPYTEALIHEVLRVTSIAPIGAFHKTTQNTQFHNYIIKKGSLICTNLHFIHHNPEIWGDPENFRPERFLSENGTTFVKNENLMAFSTGKRVCIGETLARDELFLFGTSICQRFDIVIDPAHPNPSLEPEPGFLLVAKPYTVVMKDRFE